jgi:hypothetical protein
VNARGPRWGDRVDVLAWLGLFRDVVRDLGSAAENVTRPEDERELGRVAAREAILAALQMANEMLDLGMASLLEQEGRAGLN